MRDVSEITPGLYNAEQPFEYVATAGQPTEEHLERLAEAGYKTVVDLRTPGETPRPDGWGMVVRRTGMEYVNTPPVRRGHQRISLERQVRIAAGALTAAGGLLALRVDPHFGLLSAFVGGGLVFAGVTDTCGMAKVLARLPYNRTGCDVEAMVEALKQVEPTVQLEQGRS